MAKKRPANKPDSNGTSDAHSRSPKALKNAYFLSLTLENIKCFGPAQTLDLSNGKGGPARWTIILGLNGTGKTTILQSLVGFELLPTEHWNYKSYGVEFAQSFHLSSIVDPLCFRRRNVYTRSRLISEIIVSKSIESKSSNIIESQLVFINGEGSEAISKESASPWCCGYGAGRRLGSASLTDSTFDDRVASIYTDQMNLRNPEEWLLRLDYSASKDSKIQHQQTARFNQAKELLLGVLQAGEIGGIQIPPQSSVYPNPKVEFKTPYGWVPLKQLGYGYQTLITWVADLASRMVERYPDSPNPLAEPAVVLVDEIDLHLHPIWQRKLMGFLTERFPNTQFIATAHSPLVAQAALDANLAVLRREGDHVIIDNDVDNLRNLRVDQILTSELFGLTSARPPQIEKLLDERKALLTSPKLTKTQTRRLKELEAEIGDLPTGESPQDIKEMEEIRKAIQALQEANGRKQ